MPAEAVCKKLKKMPSESLRLRTEQVRALHLLGPDYRSTFSPTESSAVLEQARRGVRQTAHF